jgi:hypothetical protein
LTRVPHAEPQEQGTQGPCACSGEEPRRLTTWCVWSLSVASARAPLFFSTELLAALLGGDRSDTWGALQKLEGDRLISRDEMTGRYSLTQRPSAKIGDALLGPLQQ